MPRKSAAAESSDVAGSQAQPCPWRWRPWEPLTRAGLEVVGRVVPALWRVGLLPWDLVPLTSVIELASARGTHGDPGACLYTLAHRSLLPLRVKRLSSSSSCHATALLVKGAVTAMGWRDVVGLSIQGCFELGSFVSTTPFLHDLPLQLRPGNSPLWVETSGTVKCVNTKTLQKVKLVSR